MDFQKSNSPANALHIPSPELRDYTLHRRFDRMARLIGDQAMERLFQSHVMVIGIGGVGSFAAESLIRSGVGRLTLIDFDDICVTNSNRQLHALTGVIGKKKVSVMAERLRRINPQATVVALERFYNEDSSKELLASKPDIVLDCIDNITAKCHLLATCKQQGIPVICSGGASGRRDPLQVKVVDLAATQVDPLLLQVRRVLRQKYAFPSEGSMGIPTVFSQENPRKPEDLKYDKGEGFHCVCPQGQNDYHSCEKRSLIWGTASFVTGNFGLVLASRAVDYLIDS